MKSLTLLFAVLFSFIFSLTAQNETFTIEIELKHTPVINQGSTGTCWSFATTSFIESEIMRKGYPETDLSEMYNVFQAYKNKTVRYLLYHGNVNFSCGGQAHDVMDVIRESGIVPNEALPGIKIKDRFNHHKLDSAMLANAVALNKTKENFDASDIKSIIPILENDLGKLKKKAKIENQKLKASEIRDKFGIEPDDYVEISSYTHHPFYKPFVLEVPDNWSHAFYHNVPVDELIEIMKFSINNGYTICWDGDTSEKTFKHKNGYADVEEKLEGKVNQKHRQETFYSRKTTDDHLMHIVGISKDSKGKTCFYTKNSWGANSNNFGGFLHMTEDYVRLKTVAILVHKKAIPEPIRKKLNL